MNTGPEENPKATSAIAERLQKLIDQNQTLLGKLADLEKSPKKDTWDKLGSLTGVVVAIVGGLFSLLYNSTQAKQDEALKKNQAELQKIQIVGTFMPYLAGNDERAKSVALSEVRDILSTQAAISLAVSVNSAKNAGTGTLDAAAVNFLHNVANTGSATDRSAAVQALEKICGHERWAVKTLADPASSSINLSPIRTTVTALNEIARPSQIPVDARLDPEEHKTYAVLADIQAVKVESDGDYHIVLKDPEGNSTLVAEIPSPGCYAGDNADLRGDFQAARELIDSTVLHGSLRRMTGNIQQARAEVTGVGFFDFLHGQMGMARNGFELHPVLQIKMLGK